WCPTLEHVLDCVDGGHAVAGSRTGHGSLCTRGPGRLVKTGIRSITCSRFLLRRDAEGPAMTLTSSGGDPRAIRTIDAGAPPTRFARGWHCIGLADGFRDGAPHAVHAFGTKLVVFADSSGKLNVL